MLMKMPPQPPPPAVSPRKRRRTVPSFPAAILPKAALVCLAMATASVLPGGRGTSLAAAAAAAGGGDRRGISWTPSSLKSGGGSSIFGTGDVGFVHARGTRTRHRQGQLYPSQPGLLLLRGGGSGGSQGRELRAAETLRWRGGGRPWFTGYEDTTDGEDSSSEEGDTTDYDRSFTEEEADTTGSDQGYMTESESSEPQEEDEESDGEQEEHDQAAGGKEEKEGSSSMSPTSRASAEDIYARTVVRRRALALTFRVMQRALIRTAFLLVAFQILPWLKHNFIAQCLLVGSLVLQTVTELVAIARSAETSGKQGTGEQGQAGSGSGKNGSPSSTPSSSSAALIGGIMKVLSPENEHGQHLDFQRMNDMFSKDAEALASAAQPKLDVPNLLATGAGERSGFPVAGMMMKAFTGFAGGKNERGATSKANKKEPGKREAKKRKALGKKTKQRGERPAPKGDNARDKHDVVGNVNDARGAEKGTSGDDNRTPTPPVVGGSSDSRGEARHPSLERGAAEVEKLSLEHIRYENKSESDHQTAATQTGAGSATGGTAEGVITGAAAGVQASSVALAQNSTAASARSQNRVFVVSFTPGKGREETLEQQMDLLSATVAFLVANGNNATDEVVLLLESGGGEVTAFGLAATKLIRLKDSGFKLTVCVDKVAASGGYMMACVADKVVVAPFAFLGSIGVVGGMPNFSKVLKKNGVDYFHFTAGQHKSLVGPFQEVTKGNLVMQQKQMDAIHQAFKNHVQRYRPSVDVEMVGTGEVWLGQEAVELHLADEVGSAMEYIQGRMANAQVFQVKRHKKKVGSAPNLVRSLLLGPLSSVAAFASSLSTIAKAIRHLQGTTNGRGDGISSWSGSGGGDSLTRTLSAVKGYARAAGLDGGMQQHSTGAGTQNGVSGRASQFDGAAGYSPSGPGTEWEGGGCADLLGRGRNSDDVAGGEGADDGWVF